MSYHEDQIVPANTESSANPLLAAALRYAGRGLKVIPLHEVTPSGACSCAGKDKCSAGKHPRTQHGLKDATTDPVLISKWWKFSPNANVGVVTGPESGVLMIGPDGPQGITDLDALATLNGGLPPTAHAKSGSGGQHYYFRWPTDARKFGNKQNHRGTKIDVRGSGGYFVAPPSRNATGAYEWLDERDPAEAPAWLLDWIAAKDAPRTSGEPGGEDPAQSAEYGRARRYVAAMPAAVSKQGGHSRTMAAARAVVYGFDLGADLGFQLLNAEFNPRCRPAWSEKELRHKCADADKDDFDKPRGYLLLDDRRGGDHQAPNDSPPPAPPRPAALAYRPFPVESLAPVLRDFVAEVAASVPADPAFAALPALVIVGAAIGAAMAVSPKADYCEVPAIWACTVGDSGTGKSPSARPAERLAFAIDSRMKVLHEAAMVDYSRALEDWNKSKESAGSHTQPRPVKPVREHFALIDCTIERLAEVAEQSPRGLVVIRDEMAGWFGSFTRYRGAAGGTDVPNWLSMFEAGPIRVHRRTGEPRDIEVDRCFVAVCGGIQPGILRGVLSNPDYIASGLAARIVFAHPPKAVPRWSEAELSQAAVDRLAAALDALLGIPYDRGVGPKIVKLSAEAKHRFIAMNDEFAAAAEREDGGPMAAAYPKATRVALRLALIDHCLRHAAAGTDPSAAGVSDESMAAGVCQARWFAHEAARVYSMCEEPGAAGGERSLLDWVRRKHPDGATPRDVLRALGRYKTSGAAEEALAGLVRAGLGSWVDRPPGPKGGAPKRVFVPSATDATGTDAAGEPDSASAARLCR